jgi:hypothetical protein
MIYVNDLGDGMGLVMARACVLARFGLFCIQGIELRVGMGLEYLLALKYNKIVRTLLLNTLLLLRRWVSAYNKSLFPNSRN